MHLLCATHTLAPIGALSAQIPTVGVRASQCVAGVLVLTFKAHRLLYHSTLGLGVIQKRRRRNDIPPVAVGSNSDY